MMMTLMTLDNREENIYHGMGEYLMDKTMMIDWKVEASSAAAVHLQQ